MSVISRIKSFFSEKRGTELYGNFNKWFKPYNIFTKKSEHTLANNEIIFAAITRLSNGMGSLPLKLYRDFNQQTQHRLNYLMSTAPNGNMTSLTFIQTMEVLRNVYGNAYAIKRYDRNFCVEALDILDPIRVEPVMEEKSGELFYKINAPNGSYYVHNSGIIHVKHISTGLKGISPIDVLRNTVDFDNKIRKFSVDQMDHSIKASFILKVNANLNEDKKKELKRQFEDFYSNSGGVIVLEPGYVLDPVNSEFIDPKLFEVEKITKARVALVFNLPPYKFGEGSDIGNEQQSLGYLQDTLLPIVRQYEQEFDKKLLTVEENMQSYGFKFNIGGLLRADTKTRGDFYFKGVRSGFFMPNEVRAWEELPPKPGGDKLYMSKDLSPIDGTGDGGGGGEK